MKIYKIAQIKGLDLGKDLNISKQEHKQQERELRNYVKAIPGKVEIICQKGKYIYEEIKNQIPGRNVDSILRQRRKLWMQRSTEIEELKELYLYVAGEEDKQKVVKLVCDIVSDQILLRDGKKRIINWATKYFKKTETEEKKEDFSESGYDPVLLELLPKEVYFELGPNRELLEIKESFGREQKNWSIMSKKIAYIAKNFNEMVQSVKNDLNSTDETTKLLALMMAITIETILRPGAIGNSATIIDQDTGEKIEIETFGVTTLQVQHIKNIRDGFVEIQFPGKKGTEQIASLTDNDIINALKQILATTTIDGDSQMLFVTKSGQHIDDSKLRKYTKGKWKHITPTDFRKYVATKNFYNYIKGEIDSFRLQLIDIISENEEKIKETVINGIIKIITEAIEATKKILNHKEGNDAWKSYISPKIILAFLSNGGLEDTLEEILIDNKNVRFSFNFENFMKFAEQL